MKKLLLASSAIALVLFTSCDKVENAYPTGAGTGSSELNWGLYPDGDSAHYAQNHWPVWTDNTNTLRNVMFEDFTGHQCITCPASTANMESLIATNPERMFAAAIHSGHIGLTGFQVTNAEFQNVMYCDEGLQIGTYFGSIAGSSFQGNPAFCVNRVKANDQFTSNAGSAIANKANDCLASTLKVNIQAATNYFPSTRGLFLHTEVDVLDNSITSDLGLVVYVVEDSLIGPQKGASNATFDTDGVVDGTNHIYVHRDIVRGCIDGKAFGRTLEASDLGANDKYYVNYSYRLPDQYNVDNMHLLIYVYDKETMEIYQVIEKHLN